MVNEINSDMVVNLGQRVALYETKARFFLVGSNNTQTRFRVLKIDRTEPRDLVVIDDKIEYNQMEIRDMLNRISHGNRQGKSGANSGLNRSISAFGLIGFVRFTEGYFLLLVTKRRRVAQIGHHVLYKIEDTSMIYIPSDSEKSSNEEAKYQKMFQNVDLSSNFYFSYSYDLSHTLQYNMHPDSSPNVEVPEGKTVWEASISNDESINATDEKSKGKQTIKRTKPYMKFVWNEYLLPKSLDLHPDWLLYIVHGFVSQSNISVFGKPLHLTLIARRSQKYAGTRFLKRGSNAQGYVGNEVETEQILHDSSISSFQAGRFTSFVQMRGSVPSHWSQDISKMVPKPLIQMDIVDPYHRTAGMHFNQLLARYGSPIKVLNLVKKRERRAHESVLSNEFINSIVYLNQFIPPAHAIEHISFDMACVNKLKDVNVMSKLSEIASYCLQETGFFKSWCSANSKSIGGFKTPEGRVFQTGTVRVNCVDCLDRTNTAQFAVGKVSLALQLQALGVLDRPNLEFETDVVRMLEELYEDHGDTLALQYGGSQLVHRIKTYRKIAPLSSHSRDIMQTLSRYYSNTFSDADKQNAINLFLGIFAPNTRNNRIWDLLTDWYLHNSIDSALREKLAMTPLTCWWDDQVAFALPRPADQVFKMCLEVTHHSLTTSEKRDERTDGFYEQYRPYELTVLAETLSFNMLHTEKDFMPHFTTDPSPFKVRLRPDKRREPQIGKLVFPSPSLSTQASISSHSSSPSEADTDEEVDDVDLDFRFRRSSSDDSVSLSSSMSDPLPCRGFETLLGNPKAKYGIELKRPKSRDIKLFNNYIQFGTQAGMFRDRSTDEQNQGKSLKLVQLNSSTPSSPIKTASPSMDDCYSIRSLRPLSQKSINVYETYVNRGKVGAKSPSKSQMALFEKYLKLSR